MHHSHEVPEGIPDSDVAKRFRLGVMPSTTRPIFGVVLDGSGKEVTVTQTYRNEGPGVYQEEVKTE